jgi:hypothetical protein
LPVGKPGCGNREASIFSDTWKSSGHSGSKREPPVGGTKDVPTHRPHLTERRLRRLRSEHRVAFYVIDRRVFFDLADLDAYVEVSRVEAME